MVRLILNCGDIKHLKERKENKWYSADTLKVKEHHNENKKQLAACFNQATKRKGTAQTSSKTSNGNALRFGRVDTLSFFM